MSDFNVDWAKASTMLGDGKEYAAIALGADAEYDAVFYLGKLPNFDLSSYTEVPHLRLRAPGAQLAVYDQPARMESVGDRPSDPDRFPAAWAAFNNGHNTNGRGTPLANWDQLREADIRRLEINGVHSIEQLASVADRHLDGLGLGGRMLREMARNYLGARPVQDPEKAAMREQMALLTATVEALSAGKPAPLPAADDPEKDELRDQVGKLTDVVNSLLARLGPDALAPATPESTADSTETSPRARRPRAAQETEHAE